MFILPPFVAATFQIAVLLCAHLVPKIVGTVGTGALVVDEAHLCPSIEFN